MSDVRGERRALAMVATEAAMQTEKDPGLFTRLQRRNALASGVAVTRHDLRDVGEGWLREDLLWLEDVDLGLWVPSPECSNCLVVPKPNVVLWVLMYNDIQVHAMPRNGGEANITIHVPPENVRLMDQGVEIGRMPAPSSSLSLRAVGGHIEIDWWGRKSVVIREGQEFRPRWPLRPSVISLSVRRYVDEAPSRTGSLYGDS